MDWRTYYSIPLPVDVPVGFQRVRLLTVAGRVINYAIKLKLSDLI